MVGHVAACNDGERQTWRLSSVRRVSRRDQIKMSEDEVLAFLDEERTVVCATNGRDGRPHLMPLWYVVRDGRLWSWTYAKSQKVRNLERDPRATLQVEAGVDYEVLRGVMLETDVAIHRETERRRRPGDRDLRALHGRRPRLTTRARWSPRRRPSASRWSSSSSRA